MKLQAAALNARTALTALALVAVATSAHAGEVLRMKTGTVDPANLAGRLSAPTNSNVVGTYVVQFNSAITRADQLNVTTLGGAIVRYLPDDALVVRSSARIANTILRSSPSVRTVVAYEPSWKVSPAFAPASVFSSKNGVVAHVRLFPLGGKSQATNDKLQKATLAKLKSIPGLEVQSSDGRSFVVAGTRGALEAVASIETVEWIQPEAKFQTLAVDFAQEGDNEPAKNTAAGDYKDIGGYETGTKLMNFDTA